MKKREWAPDVAMLLLALVSAGLLVFELSSELEPSQSKLISNIDLIIAFIFLGDFLFGLWRAEKKGVFFRKRWYELLASIPLTHETVQALRSIRVLRILRIVRIIRIVRFAARLKRVGDVFIDGPSFRLFSIALTATTLVFSGAVAFHTFEFGVNPNVQNLFDSFWWAIVTVTTIGYGDIYPVTVEGRIIAIFLMLVGIGTIGTALTTISTRATRVKEEVVHN